MVCGSESFYMIYGMQFKPIMACNALDTEAITNILCITPRDNIITNK